MGELQMSHKIRMLLVSCQPLLRAGVRSSLTTEQDLILVGEAANACEAQRLNLELKPDVLLIALHALDCTLPEIANCLREQCPEINIIILIDSDNVHIPTLMAIGVSGCVLRDEDTQLLAHAIRTVAYGGTWFSRPIIGKLVQKEIGNPTPVRELCLTNRERQILSMIARGWNNSRISHELNLAKQTVRNYISRIYTKIMVDSRAEAIVRAREYGFHRD